MPDILLIQPPIRDFYLTVKRTIPYGLACIAAELRRSGFSVEISDALATKKSRNIPLPQEMTFLESYYAAKDVSPFALFHGFRHFGYSFEHIGNIAKKSQAFIIGISSLFTAYSNEALETAEIVRKYHPDCMIVMGGHHPTAMPESVMQCKSVDFVLRGEGEVSMPLLAQAIRDKTDFSQIPGIVFRKPDGNLHIGEPAIMQNPNESPLPALDLIHHKFYQRGHGSSTVIAASRGCLMSCSYCCMAKTNYRRRNVESVMAEIDNAVMNYGVRFIDFEDEHLSSDRQWFLKLLQEIELRYSGLGIELRAMNGLFPPSLDEELIDRMKQAGFETLNLSLGSASDIQQKRFNRPNLKPSLERVLDMASKYALDAVTYIIIGAPMQTAEESLNDLLYLAKLNTIIGVSVFYPAPGSADFRLCETLGILPKHVSLMRSSALPIAHAATRLEILTLMRLGRMLNFVKALAAENIRSHPKETIGRELLQQFCQDGRIRGMTRDGEISEHEVSEKLCNKTVDFLRQYVINK